MTTNSRHQITGPIGHHEKKQHFVRRTPLTQGGGLVLVPTQPLMGAMPIFSPPVRFGVLFFSGSFDNLFFRGPFFSGSFDNVKHDY